MTRKYHERESGRKWKKMKGTGDREEKYEIPDPTNPLNYPPSRVPIFLAYHPRGGGRLKKLTYNFDKNCRMQKAEADYGCRNFFETEKTEVKIKKKKYVSFFRVYRTSRDAERGGWRGRGKKLIIIKWKIKQQKIEWLEKWKMWRRSAIRRIG